MRRKRSYPRVCCPVSLNNDGGAAPGAGGDRRLLKRHVSAYSDWSAGRAGTPGGSWEGWTETL